MDPLDSPTRSARRLAVSAPCVESRSRICTRSGCASALSCAGPSAGWRSAGTGSGALSVGIRRP
ncbi:Uncharacterised protein [Mycobacteroides abscessus]|nr:Uncharacterised protein [Mycobacteroides abscessus]